MKAFPQIFESGVLPKEETGMDLRDYFAAKAMQIVGKNWCLVEYAKDDKRMDESVAMFCYKMADAMMKAREAK